MAMSAILIIAIVLIAIYIWSSCLWGYKEKEEELTADESKCFDPGCRSIIIKQDSDKAVLMIHGFPTAPNMYRYAADRMKSEGYDVYAPLIPSFGTDWYDFTKTNFSSWYKWIEDYYKSLEGKYKEVYVIGISMGGAMTLKIAEHNNPSAIAVIAAPVVYNSFFRDRIVTSWSGYLGRIIGIFTPAIKPHIVTSRPESNDGNEDWKGYGGTFPRQGVSLMHGLKAIRRDLGKINSPMISIHDTGDKTVPFANQGIIKKETHTKSEFIVTTMDEKYRHTHHTLLQYHSIQAELMDRIISFFSNNRSAVL